MEREERKDVEIDFSRNSKDRGFRICNKNVSEYVSEKELDKYRYTHPYWKKRGITDEGIIELFDLGYDRQSGCITFPVRDVWGNCLFVARRSVNAKFFNYPKGAEKPLYGLYELELTFPDWNKSYPDIIVCESMLDALSCWQWGKYAVATNGTQASPLQFRQLEDLPCRKIILAMDNDEAGRKAAERIRRNVVGKIITEYALPKGRKDINELSRNEFENLQEIF